MTLGIRSNTTQAASARAPVKLAPQLVHSWLYASRPPRRVACGLICPWLQPRLAPELRSHLYELDLDPGFLRPGPAWPGLALRRSF